MSEHAVEPATTPGRQDAAHERSRWTLAVAALLATVTLAVSILAAQQWRDRRDLEDQHEARQTVSERAAAFADALLTYDHDDPEQAEQRVAELSTDDFAATYREAFNGGTAEAITRLGASAEAEVIDVFVSEITEDGASAVVVVDSTVKSRTESRQLTGLYLRVDLVLDDDQWKVSSSKSLAVDGQQSGPSQ